MTGELMAAEMAVQPEVLARVTARAPADTSAVRAVLPRPLAGIVFLARGSSDNAAVFGRYLAELRAGRPAGLAAPSLYTRYHATVDWHGYLVVALSQSGATPEIISTCQAARTGGAVVLGITNEPRSPLADTVDLLLSTDAGPERTVPAIGRSSRTRPPGPFPTAPWTACPVRWLPCSVTPARCGSSPAAGGTWTGWWWRAAGWPTPPRWRPRSR